jgi:hypothetical protein
MGSACVLRYQLSPEALSKWGWRVPFLGGVLLGIVGVWLRSKVEHSAYDLRLLDDSVQSSGAVGPKALDRVEGVVRDPVTDETVSAVESCSEHQQLCVSTGRATTLLPPQRKSRNPFLDVLRNHPEMLIAVSLVMSFWGCTYYSTLVWMSYFMSDPHLICAHTSQSSTAENCAVQGAWFINFAMNCCMVIAFPFAGMVGDYIQARVDKKSSSWYLLSTTQPVASEESTLELHALDRMNSSGYEYVMKFAVVVCAVVALPAFLLIITRNSFAAALGQLLFVFALALFGANAPAFLVSKFPSTTRFTGLGIGKFMASTK